MPSLWTNSFEFLDNFFTPKIDSVGEDFVILACVFFSQASVWRTDGQPDRQTSRRWLVHGLHSPVKTTFVLSVALSVCPLSYGRNFCSILMKFCTEVGSQKSKNDFVEGQNPMIPICFIFPRNAFSMGKWNTSCNEARRPIVGVESSNDVPGERLQTQSDVTWPQKIHSPFILTTNRKPHLGNPVVTWSITSRDPKG